MKLNKNIHLTLMAFVAFCLIASCTDKRTIYDQVDDPVTDDDIVDVPLDIDNSDIYLDGVDTELADQFTLIFYPIDESEPSIFVIDEGETPTVSIEKGDYSVLIINGKLDNHEGLEFTDIDNYESIKVVLGNPNLDSSLYLLYSDNIDLVTIEDNIEKLEFSLTDIFTTMHVTTYISYINLLNEEGNYATIDGLASGMYLCNRQPTLDDPTYANMDFSIFAYNVGSSSSGYLRGQFKNLGVYISEDGVSENNATLFLKLNDENYDYIQFERDITEDITVVNNDNQVLSVEIPNVVIAL